MKLLLDSHALVWWVAGFSRLSERAARLIEDADCFVSPASAYEIAVKARAGRFEIAIPLIDDFQSICEQEGFMPLPLRIEHALLAANFKSPHRDPFDRLLAAQSLVENIPIVTCDPALERFGCTAFW